MTSNFGRSRERAPWDHLRLRSFQPFSALEPAVLESIADKLTYARLRESCTLVEQDRSARCIYFLLSGAILYVVESSEGREVTVGRQTAPWYCGLVGVVGSGVHPSTVVTASEVEVLELSCRDVDWVLAQCPRLAVELIKASAVAYSMAVQRLGDQIFLSAEERACAALFDLASHALADPETATPDGDWRRVEGLAHSQLARLANTSRETACRALGRLGRLGIVVPRGDASSGYLDYDVDVQALSDLGESTRWPRVSKWSGWPNDRRQGDARTPSVARIGPARA